MPIVCWCFASGLNTSGWAYACVSNRWGESGSDGTFYDAQSFMLSVEKVLKIKA